MYVEDSSKPHICIMACMQLYVDVRRLTTYVHTHGYRCTTFEANCTCARYKNYKSKSPETATTCVKSGVATYISMYIYRSILRCVHIYVSMHMCT